MLSFLQTTARVTSDKLLQKVRAVMVDATKFVFSQNQSKLYNNSVGKIVAKFPHVVSNTDKITKLNEVIQTVSTLSLYPIGNNTKFNFFTNCFYAFLTVVTLLLGSGYTNLNVSMREILATWENCHSVLVSFSTVFKAYSNVVLLRDFGESNGAGRSNSLPVVKKSFWELKMWKKFFDSLAAANASPILKFNVVNLTEYLQGRSVYALGKVKTPATEDSVFDFLAFFSLPAPITAAPSKKAKKDPLVFTFPKLDVDVDVPKFTDGHGYQGFLTSYFNNVAEHAIAIKNERNVVVRQKLLANFALSVAIDTPAIAEKLPAKKKNAHSILLQDIAKMKASEDDVVPLLPNEPADLGTIPRKGSAPEGLDEFAIAYSG
jgi:hypothetical protein